MRNVCATCDTPIKFVPYTCPDLPGKVFDTAHCVYRYLQAKTQRDQALQLQPVQEGDACQCSLCTDDP